MAKKDERELIRAIQLAHSFQSPCSLSSVMYYTVTPLLVFCRDGTHFTGQVLSPRKESLTFCFVIFSVCVLVL